MAEVGDMILGAFLSGFRIPALEAAREGNIKYLDKLANMKSGAMTGDLVESVFEAAIESKQISVLDWAAKWTLNNYENGELKLAVHLMAAVIDYKIGEDSSFQQVNNWAISQAKALPETMTKVISTFQKLGENPDAIAALQWINRYVRPGILPGSKPASALTL